MAQIDIAELAAPRHASSCTTTRNSARKMQAMLTFLTTT